MNHLTDAQVQSLRTQLAGLSPALGGAALRRLADGTFGLCAICGDEIPHELLVASPGRGLCDACVVESETRRSGQRFGG